MTKTIVSIEVVEVEKRRVPSKHYVYVIVVKWSDSSSMVIYRRYSRFFDLQTQLLEKFPVEAGSTDPSLRVIPFLPGKIFFGRSHIRDVAMKRLKEINTYCMNLLALPSHMSQCDEVLEFFEVEPEDLDPPKQDLKQKDAGEERKGEKISGPKQLERFMAVADYSAQEKGEMSLQAGMQVEVTEKSESGWWFVNAQEHQGWVPSTYLQNMSGSAASMDTQDVHEEKYICIETYSAGNSDEVSLDKGAIVEVLQKNMDGWWTVRFESAEGFAPATYLKKSTDPYARDLVEKSRQSGVQIIGNLADVSNLLTSSSTSSSPRNSTFLSSSSASPHNSSALRPGEGKGSGDDDEDENGDGGGGKREEELDRLGEVVGVRGPGKHQSPSTSDSLAKMMLKQKSLERGGSLKPPPRQNSVNQLVVISPPPPPAKTRSSFYLTIADFQDTVGDGISFTVGETVTVLEKTDSGWWFVERGQEQGWVPESYLEQTDATHTQAGSATESHDDEGEEENTDKEDEESDDYDDDEEEEQTTQPPTSALASALNSRLNGQKFSAPPSFGGGLPKLPGKPSSATTSYSPKPPSLPLKPQDQHQSQRSPERSVDEAPGSPKQRESVSGLANALKSRFESKPQNLAAKHGGAPFSKPGPLPPHKPGPSPFSVPSKPPGPPAPPSKPGEKPVPPPAPQSKPAAPFKPAEKPKPPSLPTKLSEKPSPAKVPPKPEGSRAAGGVSSIASTLKSKFESGGPPAKPAVKPPIQTSKPPPPSKPFGGEAHAKPGFPSQKPADDGKLVLRVKPTLPSKNFGTSREEAAKSAFPSKRLTSASSSGPPKLPFKPQTGSKPASDSNINTGGVDRPRSSKVHSMAAAFGQKMDAGHSSNNNSGDARDPKPTKPTLPAKKLSPPAAAGKPGSRESSDVPGTAGKPRVGSLVSELGSKLQFGGGSVGVGGGGGSSRSPEPSPVRQSSSWAASGGGGGLESSRGGSRTTWAPSSSSASAPQLPNLLAKPPQQQPPPPAAADPSQAGMQYEVVADFAAEGDGELELRCGEVVEVVGNCLEDWWLVRRGPEEQGWVPSSYLEPAPQWDD